MSNHATSSPILRVAVNVPLSREFDYLVPPGDGTPRPGCRVEVPFGRRRETGLILELADGSSFAPDKLKQATALLDASPLLDPDDLWLIRFTSDYYHHPIGEVMAASLPSLLRQGKGLYTAVERVRLADPAIDIEAIARRAPRQAELLELLADDALPTTAELTGKLPNWRRAAKPLIARGVIAIEAASAPDAIDVPRPASGPALNEEQQAAVDRIRKAKGFEAFVLDGVTGSGKTDVYLQLIETTLAAGKQVLVLVPEIGLTPQLVSRFEKRLGFRPAALHSSLSDSERLRNWRRVRSGAARLLVGTRSAVFTPMPELGLVIVDEEHDHSFKQQEGLRYSARDLAIVRGKRRDVPVVLGSATPTLEVLKHSADGAYTHLLLPRRAGGALPPALRLIDLNRYPTRDGLSDPLLETVDAHLAQGGQALIYLNRRGFAPTLICGNCAYVAECRRCDSRMTVHASQNELRCHHCGATEAIYAECPECTGTMRPLGEGTQRLEETLVEAFPDRRIVRIDSDSMQRKGAIDAALAEATSGDADILVGTQMLSKGHHFPRLTLVGIVNADQGLFGSDFRSDERLAQSIIQVAGRAGREERAGTVMIQTAFPEHPFWQRLFESGYAGIADDALTQRRDSAWPPYTRLALLRASAHRESDAFTCLESARQHLGSVGLDGLRVLGPVSAPLRRKAGRYRAQLLLESSDRRMLHRALASVRARLEEDRAARRARWSIDVDPIDLY